MLDYKEDLNCSCRAATLFHMLLGQKTQRYPSFHRHHDAESAVSAQEYQSCVTLAWPCMLCSMMHRPRLIGYLSLLRRSLTSSGLRMNQGDLHRTRKRSQTHISCTDIMVIVVMDQELGKIWRKSWSLDLEWTDECEFDLETGWSTGWSKVPVGVFEANASLL